MFYYSFGMIGTGHHSGYIYRGETTAFLIMHFRTDFFIEVNGKVSYGKAGDFVLHAPGSVVAHGSRSKRVGFVNDWMFFLADPPETDFLHQLPIDTPIPGGEGHVFAEHLSDIISESIRMDPFSKPLISNRIYSMLTMLKRAEEEYRKSKNKTYQQFNALRIHFRKHCSEPWTLEKMAVYSGYSASHFSALYRKTFGVSPVDDLLNERIERAKRLIGLKIYKVSEVAKLCGFSSLHYFSECFKKKTGKAPTEY